MAHTFNGNTWEIEVGGSLEFEVSLVYKATFRTATPTQRNSVLKKAKQNKKKL